MTPFTRRPVLLALSAAFVMFPTRAILPRAEATAVLAGGCFWGTEYVFEHVRGVRSVVSGFARDKVTGTAADLPQAVEAVKIVYDPSVVTYKQLLDVFYRVAHDPTSKDRQGPDEGAEYRAVVFTQSDADAAAVKEYLVGLESATHFSGPIVTEVRALEKFAAAEAYHQDYSSRHLSDGYVVQNDIPKLEHLKHDFPALYQEKRAP
ncbi:MAG TPA: peptide-methionine (S)-S-oxide reductase MsrA [Gemmatimonadales bacterium]|nr:peptide-methionine (S)-S-oxide reductase MsrA [Gemmatimonadales bacterium]